MTMQRDEESTPYGELWNSAEQFNEAKKARQEIEEGAYLLAGIKALHRCKKQRAEAKLTAAESRLDEQAKGKPGEIFIAAVLDQVFRAVRKRSGTHRNAYHPEALNNLGTIAHEVSALALPCPLTPSGSLEWDPEAWEWPPAYSGISAREIPALATRLEPHNVAAWIRAAVNDHQRIATSTHFATQWETTSTGEKLTVQHVLSGMRTVFSESQDDQKKPDIGDIGEVMSKPGNIDSICSTAPDTDDVLRLSGLGIGQNLYLYAAQTFAARTWPQGVTKDFRWANKAVPPNAESLRNKLHKIDPYQWQAGSRCLICESADMPDWRKATRQDFQKTTH